MANIKLKIAYDGTRYFGWQKTKMGPSIEGVLQGVIEQVTQEEVQLQAASRTDAGVHALGQIINFKLSKHFRKEPKPFQISLNQLLPQDIVVAGVELMPESFHPTLDAQWKEYHYFASCGSFQWPHHRLYSWHFPYSVDLSMMEEASRHFIGEHDFSAMTNMRKGPLPNHFVRRIDSITLTEQADGRLMIKIRGNRFLYRMARNLAGTLLYVGCGKLKVDDIPEILKSRDRTLAGATAPAHGLFLHSVAY